MKYNWSFWGYLFLESNQVLFEISAGLTIKVVYSLCVLLLKVAIRHVIICIINLVYNNISWVAKPTFPSEIEVRHESAES